MQLMNIIINLCKTCFLKILLLMHFSIYHSLIPNNSHRQYANVFDVYPLLLCIMLKYMSFLM